MADAKLEQLSTSDLEWLIREGEAVRLERSRAALEHKRRRDAERHMDVHCPACGAQKRSRCREGGRRLEVSHPERAWKTRGCPACGAAPGEWCKVGEARVTQAHVARVEVES